MRRQASVSGGIDLLPQGKRPLDPPPPEIGVDPGAGIVGQEAERDVSPAEETEAERPATGVCRQDDLTRLRLPFYRGQGPGEEPGVAVAKSGVPSFFEYDPGVSHVWKLYQRSGESATRFCNNSS